MPKYNITVKSAEKLPKEISEILQKYFKEKDLEKLEKFGGRVQISITAPFIDKKTQNRAFKVDEDFVIKLKSNKDEIDSLLKPLTKKQLTVLSKLLGFPTTAKSGVDELRNSIIVFLNSERTWLSISGSTHNP